MSSTGVISGTPDTIEQTQFCVNGAFPSGPESLLLTMSVGTGNATLDPILIPEATQLATGEGTLLGTLEPILLGIDSLPTCVQFLLDQLVLGIPVPPSAPIAFDCLI
jgi:hypothetical protein